MKPSQHDGGFEEEILDYYSSHVKSTITDVNLKCCGSITVISGWQFRSFK